MENLISEIEAFCAEKGLTPQYVLRRACAYGWDRWSQWKAGQSTPTMANVDKLRAWMRDYSPAQPGSGKDAA